MQFSQAVIDLIGKISPKTDKISAYPMPTIDAGSGNITAGPDGNLWLLNCFE